MKYSTRTKLLVTSLLTIVFIITVTITTVMTVFPKDPPVFIFEDHKELPDGQHRYEVYYRGTRVGYVVLPGSICGVENVVVAVHD